MSNIIGADTIVASILDLGVEVENALKVGEGRTDNETGKITGNVALYTNANGVRFGKDAIYNAPNFNFTIAHKRGAVYAMLQFSPSKVVSGCNYEPATAATLKTALEILQADLTSIGVKTNLQNAALKRVDITKNIVVDKDESIKNYLQLVKILPCKFAKEEPWDYGSTILAKNGQQQLCVYSKLDEMVHNGYSIDNLPPTLRFEQRFMRRAKVRKYLGFETVSDLVNNFDHAQNKYIEAMKSNIFKLDTFDFKSTSPEKYKDELEALLQAKHRSLLQSYLILRGYRSIDNKDIFLEQFNEVMNNKVSKTRAKKLFQELQMEAMSLEVSPKDGKSSGQLYAELKKRVLS